MPLPIAPSSARPYPLDQPICPKPQRSRAPICRVEHFRTRGFSRPAVLRDLLSETATFENSQPVTVALSDNGLPANWGFVGLPVRKRYVRRLWAGEWSIFGHVWMRSPMLARAAHACAVCPCPLVPPARWLSRSPNRLVTPPAEPVTTLTCKFTRILSPWRRFANRATHAMKRELHVRQRHQRPRG